MTTQTRNEWLRERRTGIGGSDAAAVLGMSPWSTPVDVWLDKTGRSTPREETEAMRIGTELEGFVARRYSQETGREVRNYKRMIHRGCLLGNFDRLVVPEGEKIASYKDEIRTDTILECKTSSRDWDEGVPVYYQTQVQHYMGLEPKILHADVACLFLGRKHFEIYRIERDDDVIKAMFEFLTHWWERYVVGDQMPQPTNEEDCRKLWARSNPGKSVIANNEILDKVAKYRDAKATEKAAKEIAAAIQSDICAYLGDAEILTDISGKSMLTWKSGRDSVKTDWEGLAKEMGATPEVIARFTETKVGARRFLVKSDKSETAA